MSMAVQLWDPAGSNSAKVNANGGQEVVQGTPDKASFVLPFTNLAPTVAMDLFEISGASNLTLRIRRIVITNVGAQTAGALVALQFQRVTAPGTGGGATPAPMDTNSGDTYAPRAAVGVTALATAGTALHVITVFVPAAAAAMQPIVIDFGANGTKFPMIAGNNNLGFSLRHPGAAGAAGFSGYVEFTKE